MADASLHSSRRRRPSDLGATATARQGGGDIVTIIIALIVVVALGVFVIAPKQVDEALSQTASAVTEADSATGGVWSSIASTFTSDEEDGVRTVSGAPQSVTAVPTVTQTAVSGDQSRTFMTHGHDILELAPQTTLAVDETVGEDSTVTIQLLGGTLRVSAAKRANGGRLSVETQYLVATVKGTKFEVLSTADGAAVTVTEGVVSVRSAGASSGVDVTPGRTAVVLGADQMEPMLSLTPGGGPLAAIEAFRSGAVSNSNHRAR